MKAIADTMGVARLHLVERMKPKTKSARGQAYLRIMRQSGLLLVRHTGKRPQLTHEDKVGVMVKCVYGCMIRR